MKSSRLQPAALLAAAATLALAQASAAQTPASPAPAPAPAAPAPTFPGPQAFTGYSHPNITECRTVGPQRRECVAPAHVAGRYLIEAVGVATASADNATESMNITVGDQVCFAQPNAPLKGRAYIHLICQTTLLTDTPTTIAVNVAAQGGTLDPAGPQMAVRSMSWDGVISVRGANAGPIQQPAAQDGSPPPPPPPSPPAPKRGKR